MTSFMSFLSGHAVAYKVGITLSANSDYNHLLIFLRVLLIVDADYYS